ncbi:hypothetical protein [Sporobacter termitidis]|uniref:hypothetical protein n=1 Tax=Sporobacter termitidis TaxID=44749 RepID=UPI001160CF78|nr:hypothetical protein [Sporobacter termitidis]
MYMGSSCPRFFIRACRVGQTAGPHFSHQMLSIVFHFGGFSFVWRRILFSGLEIEKIKADIAGFGEQIPII